MPVDFETEEHHRLTREFILGNPTSVVVYRPQTQDDGAGGTRTLGMEPQEGLQVRFLEQESVRARGSSTTLQAQSTRFIAIAMPDADALPGDVLEAEGGRTFRVTRVTPEITYRKRLEVVVPDES